MKQIRLGRTEMMVTKIGFGSIPIQRVSEDDAIAVINRCLELGINFIDTANGYTTSEERIGKAIKGRRKGLILATKTLARTCEEIEKHLKLSLERLGVEYIDLYQFHDVSNENALKTILDPNGPRAVIEEARKAGRVKHIGITCHQIDIAKEAVNSGLFETIMFPLNFMDYEGTDALLSLAKQHDVGFIAMKPLGGGMIDDATIAIKYLLQFPDLVLIPGIERVPEIEEIAQIIEGPRTITTAEKQQMEQIKQELGTRFCRRCEYCQPCTMEIPISAVMQYPHMIKRLPPERLYTERFAEPYEKAANCNECGECEERCPYHLPIREMLAEHVRMYEAGKKELTK